MWAGKIPPRPKTHSPEGLTAVGLFSFFRWLAPRYLRVVAERTTSRSGRAEWSRICWARGTAQAANFGKSPDRERKTCQRRGVVQRHARSSRKPCRFRKVAEYARHHVEHQEPPRALVAVMEPFVMDSEAPHQPWDEDDDHHDDEERRGDGGRGEQDNCGEQPCHAKDHERAPVLCKVDASLGAEQEFEQHFHDRSARESTGEPAFGNVSP